MKAKVGIWERHFWLMLTHSPRRFAEKRILKLVERFRVAQAVTVGSGADWLTITVFCC